MSAIKTSLALAMIVGACAKTPLALAMIVAPYGGDAPDIGDRTPDGFVVKCYWTGVFDKTTRSEVRSGVGVFATSLGSGGHTQKSHAFFFATQEVDDTGKMRIVVRNATWSSTVSHLHYWSHDNQRPSAGPGGSGSGVMGAGDIQVNATEGHKTAKGESTVNLSVIIDNISNAYYFDVRYYPLETKGLSVFVSSELETGKQNANIDGFSVDNEPVKPHQPTIIRREWDVPGGRARWLVMRQCYFAHVHLITPHGNPRTAPVVSGRGQNEYTFDSAKPGKLTIKFEAVATPSSPRILQHVKDNVRFEVEGVGGSTMEWATANRGGKASVERDKLVATVTFTGLPEQIDDFGKKKVQLFVLEEAVQKTNIEVFFARDKKNHPGGQVDSPNWFYYYLQTVPKLGPKPNIKYPATGIPQAGHTSHFDPVADEICIDDGSIKPYTPPYGIFGRLYGIDTFAWCLTHEMQHYKDWVDFWDVDNQGIAKWRAAQGKTGPDDDRDGDDIPNRVEDVNLNGVYDAGDLYDWRNPRTATPGRPGNILNDFEDWDCKRHTGVRGDHRRDWADPGMQHLTLDKWDD